MDITITTRSLRTIALEVCRDWGRINYAAQPYLEAMLRLDGIDGSYGLDDARGIVLRFLGNAGSWRGETACRVKAELRGMVAA